MHNHWSMFLHATVPSTNKASQKQSELSLPLRLDNLLLLYSTEWTKTKKKSGP